MTVKLYHNKGYTLISVLVSFIIISMFSLLALNINKNDHEYMLFPYQYLYEQMLSIYNNEYRSLDDINGCLINYPIEFNNSGNVNMAQTIKCHNEEYVVELGWGKIKKR